jgi:hypothetical protein
MCVVDCRTTRRAVATGAPGIVPPAIRGPYRAPGRPSTCVGLGYRRGRRLRRYASLDLPWTRQQPASPRRPCLGCAAAPTTGPTGAPRRCRPAYCRLHGAIWLEVAPSLASLTFRNGRINSATPGMLPPVAPSRPMGVATRGVGPCALHRLKRWRRLDASAKPCGAPRETWSDARRLPTFRYGDAPPAAGTAWPPGTGHGPPASAWKRHRSNGDCPMPLSWIQPALGAGFLLVVALVSNIVCRQPR